ncbi:MAG: hypothetical protein ACI9O5_001849 [Algoriphagus sp.]|jgi:hypothetical protein
MRKAKLPDHPKKSFGQLPDFLNLDFDEFQSSL